MKKLFALLLAVLMVISMAACAANEPATTTAPKATTPAATQPAGTTAAATTTEPAKALNELPFVEPGSVKITIGLCSNATVLDYEDNVFTKYVEENTGIDIDFVFFSSDSAEAKQQLNLMVAGKERLPDIILGFLDDTLITELGRDGILVDMAPYFETSSYWFMETCQYYSAMEQGLIWGSVTDSETGSIFVFPTVSISKGVDQSAFIGGLDKVMAKNVGMDVEEIDTIAEVYEFLKKAVKEDGNGNGKADEMGLIFNQTGYRAGLEQWIINAYVFCIDEYLWNVTDGELWSPYNTDEYRQALIEMNKWYAEGLISPMAYSKLSNAEIKALLETPECYTVVGFGGHPTLVCNAWKADGTGSEIGKEYAAVKLLKAETDLGGYAAVRDSFEIIKKTGITSDCENPEIAFRLLDFLCSDEAMHTMRYGAEGVNWEHIDGEALGQKDNQGRWAGFKVLKDEWSQETKDTWHVNPVYADIPDGAPHKHGSSYFAELAEGNRSTIAYGVKWQNDVAEKPAEQVLALLYNSEEQQVIDDYRKLYKEYMLQARAQFVSGVMDPNNDADWNKYLAELEANGESDLLEAAQSAYTRLIG